LQTSKKIDGMRASLKSIFLDPAFSKSTVPNIMVENADFKNTTAIHKSIIVDKTAIKGDFYGKTSKARKQRE
jgi:hypothetical protein